MRTSKWNGSALPLLLLLVTLTFLPSCRGPCSWAGTATPPTGGCVACNSNRGCKNCCNNSGGGGACSDECDEAHDDGACFSMPCGGGLASSLVGARSLSPLGGLMSYVPTDVQGLVSSYGHTEELEGIFAWLEGNDYEFVESQLAGISSEDWGNYYPSIEAVIPSYDSYLNESCASMELDCSIAENRYVVYLDWLEGFAYWDGRFFSKSP